MENRLSEDMLGDGVSVYYDKERQMTVLQTDGNTIYFEPHVLSNFVYWISRNFKPGDEAITHSEIPDTEI